MRLAIILAALTFLLLKHCLRSERCIKWRKNSSYVSRDKSFKCVGIEDLTFFIEMKTEPQELKQIAIETLEEEAQKVCDQFNMTAVMYQVAQEKQRTSIFDTKISGGKVRGTFRCENTET